jgi:WD40 repeat protein
VLRGHHDLIHDLQWSINDDYLMSTSADCSAKIWNLSSLKDSSNDAYAEKLNYTENDGKYFVCQLLHPSFVYAGGFYPDTAEERDTRFIIATVCYDQKVRLWLISFDFEGRAQSHECLLELSIVERSGVFLGGGRSAKPTFNDQDLLDDETL